MTRRPALLYLVHRIPYPPNKGDKVRSYHCLRFLAEHFSVYLGTFVDDPEDWRYREEVESLCAGGAFFSLRPLWRKLASLPGLAGQQPLSVLYYRHHGMRSFVRRIVRRHGIKKALIFSSAMGQFVQDVPSLHTVMDFVDMDSDKWRQYAEKKSWPANWIYRREARTLFEYECKLSRSSAHSVFVSPQEAALFRQATAGRHDVARHKISHINNGVDVEYFDPALPAVNPYKYGSPVLVFTGAMDYWANVDAVCWFAATVWPAVKQAMPLARFYVVGSRPAKEVLALHGRQDTVVTGRVADVRPFIRYAHCSIAPIRIARGVQNKVLEAMAMGKFVLATSMALEGIEAPADCYRVAETAQDWVQACIAALRQNDLDRPQARAFMQKHYTWTANLQRLMDLLGN